MSKYIESSSMTNDLGSSAHRYALASHDPDGVVRWSVGGEWSASLLDHSPTLMTGPEVDAFKVRHPNARIVDVIVYREACEVYSAGCNSVLDHSERSTPQTRQAAREAGIKALIRAGFPEDALNIVGPEHTEQAPAAMKMSNYIEHPASGKTGIFAAKYDQHAERNGQTFTVLGAVDPKTYDATDCGEMFSIRFTDGVRIEAWPEEVQSAMNLPTMTKLRLRVFGSRASGEHRENSDIDVLVEGPDAEIERVKQALHYYSTEQGGPLDLFVLGAVDNTVDLVAAYSSKDAPRTVGVGDEEDLDEVLSSAFDVTCRIPDDHRVACGTGAGAPDTSPSWPA